MKALAQPLATVEKFVANEYVAACWKVVCDLPAEGANRFVKGGHDLGAYDAIGGEHRQGSCGTEGHYSIVLDENGVPTQMIEWQNIIDKNLNCTLYTDGSYTAVKDIATVTTGETIYWTTVSRQAGADQLFQHYGHTTGTDIHS